MLTSWIILKPQYAIEMGFENMKTRSDHSTMAMTVNFIKISVLMTYEFHYAS